MSTAIKPAAGKSRTRKRTPAAKRPKVGEAYFALVREFPLVPIRDDTHLDEALAVVRAMMEQTAPENPLPPDEGAYLDVLVDLVEAYEDTQHPVGAASIPEILAARMLEHGLTQAALAKKSGISQSTISAVLNGKRELTASQMRALGKVFHVDPSLFL